MYKYCHLAIEENIVMMGQNTTRDNRYYLRVFRGDQELQSGVSRYVFAEDLTVRMHGPTKLAHIIMEARQGGVFLNTASKCKESTTSRTILNGTVLLLPLQSDSAEAESAAAVEVVGAWATSFSGGVKISDPFVLLPPSALRHDATDYSGSDRAIEL
jgi:hypothetical protein